MPRRAAIFTDLRPNVQPRLGRVLFQVGGVAIVFYVLTAIALRYPITEDFMFFTPDAGEYRAVGEWVIHGTGTNATLTRPYLYPVVIALANALGGVIGVWSVQVIAWLVCILCVHLAVRIITGYRWLAWIASTVVMFNLSLFALTFHALTEVFTAMLLAVLMLFVASNYQRWATIRFFCLLALQFVALSLVRPVFFPLLALWVIVFGPLLYFRAFKAQPKALFLLVVALLPLVPQLAIMHIKHDRWGISAIGSMTFRDFLFAEGYGEVNGLNIEEARAAVHSTGERRMRRFILAHPGTYSRLYLTHLKYNTFNSEGFALQMVPGNEHPFAWMFMLRTNNLYAALHALALLPCSWLLIGDLRRRDAGRALLWAMPMAVTWCILLTSGISFWQGDRLVLSVVPVFIVLYAITGGALLSLRPASSAKNRATSSDHYGG